MGISSAMTMKERRLIHASLIEQGGEVVRDAKRGTLFAFSGGRRWMLPYGTSDHKARLAMRKEVRNLGLHWPLDPPDTPLKEIDTMTPTALADGPTLTEHERTPSQVEKRRAAGTLTREDRYRQQEQLLHQYAGREFWTEEFVEDARAREIPGYLGDSAGAGMTAAQLILDFSGFRVIESRRNRNGYSYRWARDPLMPWPTEFAPTMQGAARARHEAAQLRVGADEIEPEPETAEVATITVMSPDVEVVNNDTDDQDAELDLAVEQEQRAIRAERERDGLRVSLDKEKRDHAETRRSLMVRVARMELLVTGKEQEIARLRSLVEERDAQLREQVTPVTPSIPDGALDEKYRELQEQLEEAQADLRMAAMTRRVLATPTTTPTPATDDGWWPLEGGDQTVQQLIEGATQFGLDVRIQARRKD